MKKSKFNCPQIPQDLLTNPLLSLSAKGLYAFLQIFDQDEQLDFKLMCKTYNIKKKQFDDSITELVVHKYISVESLDGLLVFVINGI